MEQHMRFSLRYDWEHALCAVVCVVGCFAWRLRLFFFILIFEQKTNGLTERFLYQRKMILFDSVSVLLMLLLLLLFYGYLYWLKMHDVLKLIQPALKFDPGDSDSSFKNVVVNVCIYIKFYRCVCMFCWNISNEFLRSIECLWLLRFFCVSVVRWKLFEPTTTIKTRKETLNENLKKKNGRP